MVKYPFKFRYSAAVEKFLIDNNINLDHHAKIAGVYKIGDVVTIKNPALVEPHATLCRNNFFSIGAFSYSRSPMERARIGRYCSISWRCEVMGIAHPTDRISTHLFTFRTYYLNNVRRLHGRAPAAAPFDAAGSMVSIGNDVWLGQNVLLKPGISIGDGAVVAAGAIVTKDVPAFAIVAGVPARVVKYRFDEATRERAQRVAWWRYHVADFAGLDTASPVAFLEGLEARIASSSIQAYAPEVIDLAEAIQAIVAEQEAPAAAVAAR
ncbi:hypothetical protein BKE38_27115 [Pseudoroseomonas deserti]|uniref:CatB-related O-acetyltransferase n=1 Tax=Teichococcus deserti TaxID=1817963 RepID=A0A1V2GV23_9PROT|nr:CatB-related O-acetyltransferase [Pseudoroseomonas deserti]ONG44937.1 hypothetical protein BKE38_27115 [Pseudoroseomonas deserti]